MNGPELKAGRSATPQAPTFRFGRAVAYILVNIYAIKMAGVFMISTSTVVIFTGITSLLMAGSGDGVAALVLLGSFYLIWSIMVLPLWVLLINVHVLIDTLRRQNRNLHQQLSRSWPIVERRKAGLPIRMMGRGPA